MSDNPPKECEGVPTETELFGFSARRFSLPFYGFAHKVVDSSWYVTSRIEPPSTTVRGEWSGYWHPTPHCIIQMY